MPGDDNLTVFGGRPREQHSSRPGIGNETCEVAAETNNPADLGGGQAERLGEVGNGLGTKDAQWVVDRRTSF